MNFHNLPIFLLVFLINTFLMANPSGKFFCDAREMVLPSGCKAITSKQTFNVKFDLNTNTARTTKFGTLNPQYEIEFFADGKLHVMQASILNASNPNLLIQKAGRSFEKTEDFIYISSEEHFPKSSGDCNSKSFEMICMLANEDNTLDKLPAKFQTFFMIR
jgi:hypothetical protein